MEELMQKIAASLDEGHFIKLTLSKPLLKSSELTNVYVRKVSIKNEEHLSFTYRYKTNDQTKNFSTNGALEEVKNLLTGSFKNATLFTQTADYSLLISKKGKATLKKTAPSIAGNQSLSHDKAKSRRATAQAGYLQHLGICDSTGKVIPKMADKYRQINKYLEIIDNLIGSASLPKEVTVVDMGSGKGYLTFALYDFLIQNKKIKAKVVGIELRPELVDYCNTTAKACGFDGLSFVCQPIEDYTDSKIDILIALHACDTATDDAIAKGIHANAQLIVCAPCCHKQVRQQVKGKEQNSPVLKYGIFKERQFEMVTDTVRALILEQHRYQSRIFEFVSNEHTRKNIMLVGVKGTKSNPAAQDKINQLKKEYALDQHYLETLV